MRIALVTDYYLPTLGGTQTAVKAHREALEAAGHEATVFAPLLQPGGDPGVEGLPISPVFRPDGFPFAWSPRRIAEQLRESFARRRIEVVHTHSEMFAALGAIEAARDLGLPVVHTMHGRVDVYTARTLPLPSLSTRLLAALHARHVSPRGVSVPGGTAYTATATARRMWRLMAAQSRASAHVIVPSAHFTAKLAAQGVATPMTVLSNGLEPSVLARVGSPVERALEPGEPLRLLWVGRLSPEKRPAVLAEAARSFGAGVTVDVYGEGMARPSLERMRAPVTLHGAVPQEAVLEAMRGAHALVSSSLDFDNQPMVILEAIASGLPVIHCDPDLAEAVPAGGGFLTPTPDAPGLVATVRTLRTDPAAIGSASRAMLAARGGVAQRIDGLLGVYETALAAGPADRIR